MMTELRAFHKEHGARFETWRGRQVVSRYRRPERTHRAVRNGVGVIESPYGVIEVSGDDRLEYVNNILTNEIPERDGFGCYSFLLTPQGRIKTEMCVFNAGERILILVPPGLATPTVDSWEVFIQDVELTVASDDYVVFGVHGPAATEKITSVLRQASAPTSCFSFVRGSIGDAGVTVIRTDAPAGEESYSVICSSVEAVDVLDTLINKGMNAVPFGRTTWLTATLEAGTPSFEAELADRIPNVTGVRNAVNFKKGCFVGQEVVSKVENRGRPSQRLVGIRTERLPTTGASVDLGDESVGEITRAVISPSLDEPIAFAYVKYDLDEFSGVTIRIDGEDVAAEVVSVPFVEGSERSGRLPSYESSGNGESDAESNARR